MVRETDDSSCVIEYTVIIMVKLQTSVYLVQVWTRFCMLIRSVYIVNHCIRQLRYKFGRETTQLLFSKLSQSFSFRGSYRIIISAEEDMA